MTFYEQVIGFAATLVCLAGFVMALMSYYRAGGGARVAIVAVSWVLAVALYSGVFFVLPEDSGIGYFALVVLTFVFVFAFWGVIDLALHSGVRLRGGETARFLQGAALLVLSLALFAAAYFLTDVLDALGLDAGFGAYLLGVLGTAVAAILFFRAGARAVYANRAAARSLLTTRQAEVEVLPEEPAYPTGGTVRAAVRVKVKKDIEVGEARAELLYTGHYSYLSPDPRGGSLLIDGTDRVVADTESLPIGGTIRRGKKAEYRAALDLPPVAPPTGVGEITGVAWAVRVVLTVRGSIDIETKAPITVFTTRDTYSERAEGEAEPGSSRGVDVKLRTATRHRGAGGRIEGRLVITPGEALEAGAVRVELVRREVVRREDGNHRETIEAAETLAGRTRFGPQTSKAYAFDLEVPEDLSCPGSETAHTYVGWFLRATIGRRARPDHTVEQELNVFGGLRSGRTA